jgi:hypothetical protein
MTPAQKEAAKAAAFERLIAALHITIAVASREGHKPAEWRICSLLADVAVHGDAGSGARMVAHLKLLGLPVDLIPGDISYLQCETGYRFAIPLDIRSL